MLYGGFMTTISRAATVLIAISIAGAPLANGQECQESFDSTFELIQQAIFERNGCTNATCHSADAPAGGLDLTAEAAYDSLVDGAVQSVALAPTVRRVVPAKKEESLLWLNLAAATLPDSWTAPLRPMPLGGLPALTLDELEVIQLWIERGAPREGVVEGTGDLLDACLPPTQPLATKPLDPPPPGVGLQVKAPTQILAPHSEREVCFITYYDFTDRVPEEFRGPGGDTFRYKRIDARQDPLSHHAVVVDYDGNTPLDSPVWGAWTCGGGERHGESCEPTDLGSCGDGVCMSTPQSAVGCIGFGPGDASIGFGNESLFNTMAAGLGTLDGIYAEAPLSGILIWNSHSFNVTDEPGKLDIWVNLYFAPEDEQRHELERFTVIDSLFRIDVPPFGTQLLCDHHVVPPDTQIIELSSHNHKRGVRFQTFEGSFRCQGGPKPGAACSPRDDQDDLGAPDICGGAPCAGFLAPAAGDCNGDLVVKVDEVVTGVGIALGTIAPSLCRRADPDDSGSVSISELVVAVRALLEPEMRDPAASTLYTSLFYSDPAVLKFDPPMNLGGAAASDEERTLTYCGLYDNGFLDPSDVKRKSTSPSAPSGFPLGSCRETVACAAGKIGAPCSTDVQCDSAPGAGDGACDACAVKFGATTDDEMFILLGAGYRE